MTFRPFTIPAAKSKSFKAIDAIDVAARYLVYKLYEATDGQPMRWATLRGIGELRATVERAVERGWVILEGTSGKPLERKAALTDEGRRLARRGGRDKRQMLSKLVHEDARKFVRSLYKATEGIPMQWRTILGLSVKQAAVDYAVENEGCRKGTLSVAHGSAN